MKKKIYLGSDHAGFELKEKVKKWLDKQNLVFEDCGNLVYDKNDDYPDYAVKVAKKVVTTKRKGILFCGSAEGMYIAANKIKGARAVGPADIEKTVFARKHEDVNILCLAGGKSRQKQKPVSLVQAKKMILAFLETPFSGAIRHVRRLNKIKRYEK